MKLLYYPDERLNLVCESCKSCDVTLDIVKKMTYIMRKKNGIGLAAPQVGINKRFFIMEYQNGLLAGDVVVHINPRITVLSEDKNNIIEGCLSIHDKKTTQKRSYYIQMIYEDLDGFTRKSGHIDIDAAIIQHEIDHLNGILMIDRINHG